MCDDTLTRQAATTLLECARAIDDARDHHFQASPADLSQHARQLAARMLATLPGAAAPPLTPEQFAVDTSNAITGEYIETISSDEAAQRVALWTYPAEHIYSSTYKARALADLRDGKIRLAAGVAYLRTQPQGALAQ